MGCIAVSRVNTDGRAWLMVSCGEINSKRFKGPQRGDCGAFQGVVWAARAALAVIGGLGASLEGMLKLKSN